VCFARRGVVVCKSPDVEIAQEAGVVYNAGGNENGGVGGKKQFISSISCDLLVEHVLLAQ